MHISSLNELVHNGHTLKQISEITGNTIPSIRYWLKKYNLKTHNSKLASQNSMRNVWSQTDKLKKIIKESYTIAEILRKIEIKPSSGNYATFRHFVIKNKVDISHLGKTKPPVHFDILPLEEVMVENSTYSRKSLKKRLLDSGIKKNQCEVCGLSEWRGEKLIMILDHINGVSSDNRIENLRMVCPNCNSQLPTHCRGHKKINRAIKKNCMDCGTGLNESRSKRCVLCNNRHLSLKMRKVKRPSLSKLIKQVDRNGFTGTGRLYGVSDNTIRKWIKSCDESYFKKRERRKNG